MKKLFDLYANITPSDADDGEENLLTFAYVTFKMMP
jgi:hypothetical protein